MQHHLFYHIALLPLDFYVLQTLLQARYFLLCLLLLIDKLVSLNFEPFLLNFKRFNSVLLLISHFHYMIVFLADA
jgi:hypothetical protein